MDSAELIYGDGVPTSHHMENGDGKSGFGLTAEAAVGKRKKEGREIK